MSDNDQLKEQLIKVLDGHAHMSFHDVIEDFPMEKINDKAPNSDYTPWRLIEHMRFTQRDILDYIRNSDYREPNWPQDYWPAQDFQATTEQWQNTIRDFGNDLMEIKRMIKEESMDLFAKIPGTEHTLIREIIMVADHNAYHIGEFGILRSVMKTWGKNKSKI